MNIRLVATDENAHEKRGINRFALRMFFPIFAVTFPILELAI